MKIPSWLYKGVLVSVIAGVIILFIQYSIFEKKQSEPSPMIDARNSSGTINTIGQIGNNTVNNKVVVQKQIANLQDTLIQEDKARVLEVFGSEDLDKKVKKIFPPESYGPNGMAIVMVELNKIPLLNSITVQTQSQTIAPSTIGSFGNILKLQFRKTIPNFILGNGTDFLNVSYIPDPRNNNKIYSLKGSRFEYGNDGQVYFYEGIASSGTSIS